MYCKRGLRYLNDSGIKYNVPVALIPWLREKNSLTKRLIRICPGILTVKVLKQDWGQTNFEETQALGMKYRSRIWQREVLLLCNKQPWIFARTIIPIITIMGPGRRLMYLKNRPLGSALFNDPAIIRRNIKIFCCNSNHPLYQKALISYSPLTSPPIFWGRHSLFWIGIKQLLVTEIFLQQPKKN